MDDFIRSFSEALMNFAKDLIRWKREQTANYDLLYRIPYWQIVGSDDYANDFVADAAKMQTHMNLMREPEPGMDNREAHQNIVSRLSPQIGRHLSFCVQQGGNPLLTQEAGELLKQLPLVEQHLRQSHLPKPRL